MLSIFVSLKLRQRRSNFETMINLHKTIQHGIFVMKLNHVTGTSFFENPQAQIGMLALGFKKSTENCG